MCVVCEYFHRIETTARHRHSMIFLFFVCEFILMLPMHVLYSPRCVYYLVCTFGASPCTPTRYIYVCLGYVCFYSGSSTGFFSVWQSRRAFPLAAMCQPQQVQYIFEQLFFSSPFAVQRTLGMTLSQCSVVDVIVIAIAAKCDKVFQTRTHTNTVSVRLWVLWVCARCIVQLFILNICACDTIVAMLCMYAVKAL